MITFVEAPVAASALTVAASTSAST